jgi:hypothetical protein
VFLCAGNVASEDMVDVFVDLFHVYSEGTHPTIHISPVDHLLLLILESVFGNDDSIITS